MFQLKDDGFFIGDIMRIKKAHQGNYTQVHNSVVNCSELSAKAKGIYLYLYSKPDDWNFSEKRIADDFTDGKHSINGAIKELIKVGLLERTRIAPTRDNKTGKYKSEVEYVIHYEY